MAHSQVPAGACVYVVWKAVIGPASSQGWEGGPDAQVGRGEWTLLICTAEF